MSLKNNLKSLTRDNSLTNVVKEIRQGALKQGTLNSYPIASPDANQNIHLNIQAIIKQITSEVSKKVLEEVKNSSKIEYVLQQGSSKVKDLVFEGTSNTNAGYFVKYPKPFKTKPCFLANLESTENKPDGGLKQIRLYNTYTKPENELEGFYITMNYAAPEYVINWVAISDQ